MQLKRLLNSETFIFPVVLVIGSIVLLSEMAVAQGPVEDVDQEQIEEVVVTGTFIKRSGLTTGSPVAVVGLDDIRDSGRVSFGKVIENLTFNIGSENNADIFAQGGSTGTESVNLRGIGLNSTLVLLNGRRQAPSPSFANNGKTFTDIASLPPAIAMERIEALKDGASVLYGSDAIAGVVNFITRKNFDGVELQFDGLAAPDSGDRVDMHRDITFQALVGKTFDAGHFTAAFAYRDRNQFPAFEEDWTFGGAPSSLSNFLPSPGPGESPAEFGARAGAFFASGGVKDIDCLNVPAASADPVMAFILQNGSCAAEAFQWLSIVDEERQLKGFAEFEYDILNNVTFFGEFHFSSNDVERANTPTLPMFGITIPENNPFLQLNAFRRGIPAGNLSTLGGRILSGPVPEFNRGGPVDPTGFLDRDKKHLVFGIKGDIAPLEDKNWTYDVAITWSEHSSSGFTGLDLHKPSVENALRGLGGPDCNPQTGTPGVAPCFFLNPFLSQFVPDGTIDQASLDMFGIDSLANSQELLEFIYTPLVNNTDQQIWNYEAVLTGNVFDLPAGPVGLAIGGMYRRESLVSKPSGDQRRFELAFLFGSAAEDLSRDVYGIFAETLLPLANANSAIGALELSAAIRFEDYGGGVGSTTDPKVSALWNPVSDLAVRGSFSTSFRAPALNQVSGIDTSAEPFGDTNLNIPGNQFGFGAGIARGNPNLSPEDATTFNFGFTYAPDEGSLRGLSLSADYWNIDVEDLVTKEVPQAIVARAAAGDPTALARLNFDSAGTISSVEVDFINAGGIEAAGLDFEVSLARQWGRFGLFNPFFRGTIVTKYDIQEGQGGPEIDGLGSRNANNIGTSMPEFKANLGLNWALGRHSANVIFRYITDYTNDDVVAVIGRQKGVDPTLSKIDDHLTVDLQYSVELPQFWQPAEGPRFTVGVINLTDEEPPVVLANPGFDPRVHDPRGRLVYLRLIQAF